MTDEDVEFLQETTDIRNNYIKGRWEQLYGLCKETNEDIHKYLFATNAGGAVAILAYLGSVAGNGGSLIAAKTALGYFFIGLILLGILKAYILHHYESLDTNYKAGVKKYYERTMEWEALVKSDEDKVGNSKIPYIIGYGSFFAFILGCLVGGFGIL